VVKLLIQILLEWFSKSIEYRCKKNIALQPTTHVKNLVSFDITKQHPSAFWSFWCIGIFALLPVIETTEKKQKYINSKYLFFNLNVKTCLNVLVKIQMDE
jgi:hypothetical protein